MADPLIDPADLRGVRFPGSFRRYDARAVDDFLESVAQRIEATNDLVARLRAELGQTEPAVASSSTITVLRDEPGDEPASPFDEPVVEPEPEPVAEVEPAPAVAPAESPPDLAVMSDDEIARLVGEETAHVLGTARSAASEIRSKAEESAARLIRESTTEAKQLTDDARTQADALVAEARTTRDDAVREAEAEVASLRADAESHAERIKTAAEADVAVAVERAESIRAEADEAAARLRADADAEAERILEEARTEGRSMLAEAKQVRARVLTDLQRRRDLAREQVDRLLAGRERLLEAYAAVRTNIDDITARFEGAVVEAGEPVADLDQTIAAAVADAEEAAVDLRSDDDTATEDTATGDDVEDVSAEETVDTGTSTDTDAVPSPPEGPVDADAPDGPDAEEVAPAEGAADDAEPEAGPEPDEGTVDPWAATADERASDDAGAATSGDGDGDGDDDEGDVDALFARIRAERAQSVARAQEVLGEGEPATADPGDAATDDGTATDDDAAGDDTATAGDDGDPVPAELRADDEQYAARAEVLDAVDKKLARAMKRRLADEQNRVLDALRQAGSTAFVDVVPSEDEHVAAYAKVARTHLTAAAAAGAGGAEIDVDELADALGRTLIEPFRRRIERATVDVDGDADALDDRLRALYREWKVEHIGPAVTDALVAAYSAGQLGGAGADVRLRWLIEPGSKACPDCHDNALAGGVEAGSPFPTEVVHPPAHPGCRCLLVVDT